MTKKHFIDAAAIVRNIRTGQYTCEFPTWADSSRNVSGIDTTDEWYTRAVQTAEAFIMLFSAANPRFDTQRFLMACGLAEKPAKTKTPRKVRA